MTPKREGASALRILLMGEGSLFREGLRSLLEELPYPVEIDIAADPRGVPADRVYDLVFVGVLPPGADYGAAVAEARAVVGKSPVAVLALADSPSLVRAAISAGAAGFVPTLSPPRVVLHAVELMLSGGVYLPPSVLTGANGIARGATDGGAGEIHLTPRQEAVLRELARGQSNKQIAGALGLSEATVKVHIAAIMRSLKAQNRTQAVLSATEAGILENH